MNTKTFVQVFNSVALLIVAVLVVTALVASPVQAAHTPAAGLQGTAQDVPQCDMLPECGYIRMHLSGAASGSPGIPVTGGSAVRNQECQAVQATSATQESLYVGFGYHLVRTNCGAGLR